MRRAVWVFAAWSIWLAPPQQQPAQPPPQPASPVPATRLQTRWGEKLDRTQVLPEYPRPRMVGEMAEPQRRMDVCADPSLRRPALGIPRPYSRAVPDRIAVERRRRVGHARPAALVPADVRIPVARYGTPAAAALWRGGLGIECLGERPRSRCAPGRIDPWTVDITDALQAAAAEQELVVAVRDPSDGGEQPRGKQVLRPRSIYYTAVTGIWQTVWLEPVRPAMSRRCRSIPISTAGASACWCPPQVERGAPP